MQLSGIGYQIVVYKYPMLNGNTGIGTQVAPSSGVRGHPGVEPSASLRRTTPIPPFSPSGKL
jgi:hypothetical protein